MTATPTKMTPILGFIRGFQGKTSWGRVCSLIALVVAIIGEFRGIETEHLLIWLGLALGNYGIIKTAEIRGRQIGVEAPMSDGDSVEPFNPTAPNCKAARNKPGVKPDDLKLGGTD